VKLKNFAQAVIAAVLAGVMAVPALAAGPKKTILIVDMGNIMRSVIAQELIKQKLAADGLSDQYDVLSRGIQGTPASPVVPTHDNLSYYNKANGSNAWESSEPALKKLGIEEALKKHKATVVSAADLESASIVVVTDAKVMDNPKYGLKAQFPGYEKKMILITALVGSNKGIADAYQAGTKGNKYESTIYQVADIVARGYKNLLKRMK
jgi:protein-tyrosine-phosphatase